GQTGNLFGDDYDPFYMVNIKTKMLMVKSHSMLESVVVDNHLDQNQQFLQAGGKKSVWEALHLIGVRVGLASKADEPTASEAVGGVVTANTTTNAGTRTPEEKKRIEGCISMLNGGIAVEPVKETRALRISFSHSDPEMAAMVANNLA